MTTMRMVTMMMTAIKAPTITPTGEPGACAVAAKDVTEVVMAKTKQLKFLPLTYNPENAIGWTMLLVAG